MTPPELETSEPAPTVKVSPADCRAVDREARRIEALAARFESEEIHDLDDWRARAAAEK